jgi:GT2 family glycosyltransferase
MSAFGSGIRSPLLNVLIINWNSWHYLAPCVRTILNSDYGDLETIVIDNASVDGSSAKIRATFPQVRLIQNQVNVGHTRAVNQGFGLAGADLVLLLDADTELTTDAIGIMVRFLGQNPELDLVVPRTFNSDGTVQETARNFPTAVSGLFGRHGLLTRIYPENPLSRRYLGRENIDRTQPFQVESVASSCMLLRKSLIDRFGLWDEDYPGYFVDTDWCFRLNRAGVKVYCLPAAKIVHHEQNSRTRKRSPSRIWMFHMGALRFYRKNLSLGRADPRTLLACLALSLRAGILIVLNAFKESAPVTAQSEGAAVVSPEFLDKR